MGAEGVLKEIIAEDFPDLERELDTWVHKSNRPPYYLKAIRSSPRHNILKLSKVNNKKRILKAASKKQKGL